jgi:hypothetical protein
MPAKPIVAISSLLFLAALLAGSAVPADTTLSAKAIKASLRTATPEEGDFIERAVAAAESGKLPPAVLESTFQWAKRKPNFRFQYFKRGLSYRAAKLGISL